MWCGREAAYFPPPAPWEGREQHIVGTVVYTEPGRETTAATQSLGWASIVGHDLGEGICVQKQEKVLCFGSMTQTC